METPAHPQKLTPPTVPRKPSRIPETTTTTTTKTEDSVATSMEETLTPIAPTTARTTTTTTSTTTTATNLHVGFDALPLQVRRKCLTKGFQFTLMVVGESGLGKSTLINSLFLTDLYVGTMYEQPDKMDDELLYENTTPTAKTLTINESTFQLQEGDVDLSLTIIDTPGFGDDVDNTDSWNSIVKTVEQKLKDYLNVESRVVRKGCVLDKRVHCCLYFVSPNSHGLKPLDIEFMKALHKKVNVVPIIAKADTLTSEECVALKEQILEQIDENDINIYTFPQLTNETSGYRDDEDYTSRILFAVVGSTMLYKVGNEKVIRGRKYPWGVVDADNLDHCDFVALRNLLLCSHMQDLSHASLPLEIPSLILFYCSKLKLLIFLFSAKV